MKLSWEIDGVAITINTLEDGLEAGLEKAIDQILDNLESDAKDRVAVRPTVFTGDLYSSFDQQTRNANTKGVKGRLVNSTKHAGAIEHGVHPSKYADGAPPIEALMPWVIAKLSDWNIETGDGGGGGATGSSVQVSPDKPTTTGTAEDAGARNSWSRFNNNGFETKELWNGQRVVVYDEYAGKYKPGAIDSISNRGDVGVEFDDGTYDLFDWTGGTYDTGNGLVAGEDWNLLDESTQREIARDMLQSVDVEGFDQQYRERIRGVLDEYADRVKDPTLTKELAIGLRKIGEDDPSKSRKGVWTGDETGGTIGLNADGQSDEDTMRHELGHALISVLGFDYNTGARHENLNKGEKWNSIKRWDKNNLNWKYDEMGAENWDTSTGNVLPHPSTYMMYSSEERDGVFLYDDVNHDKFDAWEEHIRLRVKEELQQVDGDTTPDYDPFYDEVRAVQQAREGDAIKLIYSKGDKYKEFHFKVEHGVKEDESGTRYIKVSTEDREVNIPVADDDTIEPDVMIYDGFLPGGADDLDGGSDDLVDTSDIPDDPGLQTDLGDELGVFVEAINRKLWTEITADEFGDYEDRSDYLMRSDGYSATNAQETVAHLMAIIFSEDQLNKGDGHQLELILDKNPELLYTANQLFDFSPEMKQALEDKTGIDFEDLMYDIYVNDIQ